MNVKCFLFGHQIRSENEYMDSGYHICLHCGSHEYYHAKEWEKHGVVYKTIEGISRGICAPFMVIKEVLYERCWYCDKLCRVLWFSVGNHMRHDDIPF